MKILFITPSPPNSLNRIRSKNIIISLSKLDHEIFLISLVKNNKEQLSLELMRSYVKGLIGIKQPIWLSTLQCIVGLFLPIPLRVSYCYSKKLIKELKKEKYNDFDIVYIKRLRMAQYAKLFADKDRIFIDLTDSMIKYYQRLKDASKGLSKILALEEYYKHKLYEPKICNKYKNIIICSQSDKRYLINNFGCSKNKFYVLENGINLDEWRCKQKIIKNNLYNLVFWGVMNAETNVLSCKFFINKVIPLLPDKYSLSVVGPKPKRELTQYSGKKIRFTCYVDNICKTLSNMGIFVCPIVSGAGINNKIMQASLMGMPIVSTSLGVEGITGKLKRYILVADGPQDFANKIEQILNMDKASLENLQAKQIKITREYYNVYNIVKKFSNKFLV